MVVKMKKIQAVIVVSLVTWGVIVWIGARQEAETTYSRPIVQLYGSDPIAGDRANTGSSDQNVSIAAPAFKLKDEKEKPFTLQSFKGKWILLNFWASWCPPCVEELPSLLEFARRIAPQLGLVVVGVSEDETWQGVKQLFSEQRWSSTSQGFISLIDTASAVALLYGTTKYPETYLIGSDSKIYRKFIGAQNWMSPAIKSVIEVEISKWGSLKH